MAMVRVYWIYIQYKHTHHTCHVNIVWLFLSIGRIRFDLNKEFGSQNGLAGNALRSKNHPSDVCAFVCLGAISFCLFVITGWFVQLSPNESNLNFLPVFVFSENEILLLIRNDDNINGETNGKRKKITNFLKIAIFFSGYLCLYS